jgi:hypothetical protein
MQMDFTSSCKNVMAFNLGHNHYQQNISNQTNITKYKETKSFQQRIIMPVTVLASTTGLQWISLQSLQSHGHSHREEALMFF